MGRVFLDVLFPSFDSFFCCLSSSCVLECFLAISIMLLRMEVLAETLSVMPVELKWPFAVDSSGVICSELSSPWLPISLNIDDVDWWESVIESFSESSTLLPTSTAVLVTSERKSGVSRSGAGLAAASSSSDPGLTIIFAACMVRGRASEHTREMSTACTLRLFTAGWGCCEWGEGRGKWERRKGGGERGGKRVNGDGGGGK